MDDDHIPLLLTCLLYESEDPQATLAEIRRVVEVLEDALQSSQEVQCHYTRLN